MAKEKLIKARVLAACGYGGCNDVVELDAEVVAAGVKVGQLDDSAAAVAYAESLKAGE